jgi:hypothetical protein
MVNRWIWQEPNWPRFHWDAPRLAPVLHRAHTKRLELQQLLKELDTNLIPEASAALISRESLSTAGIEGEQLDPADVRSSVARRLQLPLESRQPRTNIKVDGLVNLLLSASSQLETPLCMGPCMPGTARCSPHALMACVRSASGACGTTTRCRWCLARSVAKRCTLRRHRVRDWKRNCSS